MSTISPIGVVTWIFMFLSLLFFLIGFSTDHFLVWEEYDVNFGLWKPGALDSEAYMKGTQAMACFGFITMFIGAGILQCADRCGSGSRMVAHLTAGIVLLLSSLFTAGSLLIFALKYPHLNSGTFVLGWSYILLGTSACCLLITAVLTAVDAFFGPDVTPED